MKLRTVSFLGLFLAACASKPAAKPNPTASASSTPAPAPTAAAPSADVDPFLWLEDVTGDRALAWAREQNKVSQAELEAVPGFATLKDRLRRIMDSKEKIPWVGKLGAHYYNFWRDEVHVRGLWRRTTLAEYQKAQPAWETVLDLDALAKQENENWVWGGEICLYPKRERCLVMFSRGGGDAIVVREFDTTTKAFVAGGFALPEAKTEVFWKDRDTIYVGTDFGPGSLTDSGYARIVKEWKRGTPLASATTVFEAQKTDVGVGAARWWGHGRVRDVVSRVVTTFTTETFVREGDKLVKIDVPLDVADVSFWDDQILIRLRSAWTIAGKTWPEGALLATSYDAFRKGGRDFVLLFTPNPHKSFASMALLKSGIVVNELEDVHNKLYAWTRKGGAWVSRTIPTVGLGALGATPVEAYDSDDYWFTATDFTTPTTLALGTLGASDKAPRKLKQSPTYFVADGLVATQHFATSKDGTRVPYFQVAKKGLALDGSNPTLLTGYGGFEIAMEPYYSGVTGAAWLEQGGVFVLANIRGGGEYGPAWHESAIKHNRQRAYDDFIAVAEDLIARKVTTSARLGIEGGSNGGLLMGVMLTQRPALFGAIVCSVPLLDMKRYHKLLAGASWMGEFGDPDQPDDWAALAKYSPYQNVRRDGKYPRTLFTTSTRDDRVHPGHARKMVARMRSFGHDVLYYENIEGGHGGAANNEQRAYLSAIEWSFLKRQLGLK